MCRGHEQVEVAVTAQLRATQIVPYAAPDPMHTAGVLGRFLKIYLLLPYVYV